MVLYDFSVQYTTHDTISQNKRISTDYIPLANLCPDRLNMDNKKGRRKISSISKKRKKKGALSSLSCSVRVVSFHKKSFYSGNIETIQGFG